MLISEGNPNALIFSVGGSSIFLAGADNDEHLEQLLRVKGKYGFVVVILYAQKAILEHRYLQVSVRNKEGFLDIWNNWNNVEKLYWEKCADFIVETSELVL